MDRIGRRSNTGVRGNNPFNCLLSFEFSCEWIVSIGMESAWDVGGSVTLDHDATRDIFGIRFFPLVHSLTFHLVGPGDMGCVLSLPLLLVYVHMEWSMLSIPGRRFCLLYRPR